MGFKNYSIKDLKFYYDSYVNCDKFPTFFHWLMFLKENDLY